jgi:hypothetical protein
MDFTEPQERTDLRKAVRTLGEKYGIEYFLKQAAQASTPTSCGTRRAASATSASTSPRPTAAAVATSPISPPSARNSAPQAARCC